MTPKAKAVRTLTDGPRVLWLQRPEHRLAHTERAHLTCRSLRIPSPGSQAQRCSSWDDKLYGTDTLYKKLPAFHVSTHFACKLTTRLGTEFAYPRKSLLSCTRPLSGLLVRLSLRTASPESKRPLSFPLFWCGCGGGCGKSIPLPNLKQPLRRWRWASRILGGVCLGRGWTGSPAPQRSLSNTAGWGLSFIIVSTLHFLWIN